MTEFLRKVTKQDVRNTIAVTWMIMSFIFLFKLLAKEIPAGNKDVVNAIAGLVIGQLVVIMAFYFVSSKTETDQKKADNEKDN